MRRKCSRLGGVERKPPARHSLYQAMGVLGAGLALLPHAPVHGQVVSLGSLDGSNGFRLAGWASSKAGQSVCGAGDVNGDGFGDVIVGVPLADAGGHSYAGAAFVVFGKAGGWPASMDLASVNGTNGFRIEGECANQYLGESVAGAGDVNADGYDDVIVATTGTSPGGPDRAGAAYVIFGKASGWGASMPVGALNGIDGFKMNGVGLYDRLGKSVSGAGDINADGYADILAAAYSASPDGGPSVGSVYAVFGRASFPANLGLSTPDGTSVMRIDGESGGSLGNSVAGAGDVNNDGYDDMVLGDCFIASPVVGGAGRANVVFGKSSGLFPAVLKVGDLDGTNGFKLRGDQCGDSLGSGVSGTGDINGDGIDDLLVGSHFSQLNCASTLYESGHAFATFGRTSAWPAIVSNDSLDGTNGFRLTGSGRDHEMGYCVSGAGDFNGDGFGDMLVGAHYASFAGSESGSTFLLFGKSGAFDPSKDLRTLTTGDGFRFDGALAWAYSGHSVASAGDVNGDGVADVIISAHGTHIGSGYEGAAYVVFGSAAAASSATYKASTPAGDAPPTAPGSDGTGRISVPASRVWIDFDSGDASLETVVLSRTKAGLSNIEPYSEVANVAWQLSSTRTGWSSATLTFHYTDSEIAGLQESTMRVCKAPTPSGPWSALPSTVDAARNRITATVNGFSYFTVANSTVAPVTLSGLLLE